MRPANWLAAVGLLLFTSLPLVCGAQEKALDPPAPPLSKQEQQHQADLQRDIQIGEKAKVEVEKEYKLSKNREYIERVQRVGGQIAAIAKVLRVETLWGDDRLNTFNYEFRVLEGDDVNAFSLPGGFIYVYEGFMKYIESDDELAGVMAHEVSHASMRHLATLEKESQRLQTVSLPLLLVAILGGGSSGSDALVLNQLIGLAVGSGWSVKAEQAADYGGFQYIMHSQYNPVGLLTFIERLARDERSQPARLVDWGIFRTHPPSRERAEALMGWLRDNHIPIRRSQVTTTFSTKVVPSEGGGGGVDVQFGGKPLFTFGGDSALQRADAASASLNAFFDNVPELFEVRTMSDGMIEGQGKFLFRVTAEDAALAKMSVSQLVDDTEQRIKRALYMISFRIWDGR
ncbi:MAG: M48 family metalloprotease [Fimbriimonadaceae bacterium]|nr:M48 family metalloprotease [Fimbriimonadaceae bacterium]